MLMCNQLVSFDGFKVFASSNSEFHLKIKESLLISLSLPLLLFVVKLQLSPSPFHPMKDEKLLSVDRYQEILLTAINSIDETHPIINN